MKKIFAIAWKDTIIRFSGFSELLFFIILPIVFTFLLAGGSPSGNATNDRVRLVVVDSANTSISQEIVAELDNSTAVYPDVLSLAEAEEEFDSRHADAVLVIPAGLDLESIQNGSAELDFRQQPNSMDATIAQRAIQTAIRRVSSAVNAANMAVDEAKARGTGGPDQAAYDALNQVRLRGRATGTKALSPADGLNASQFADAVVEERAWEFAAERTRWFDLVRLECPQHPTEALVAQDVVDGAELGLLTMQARENLHVPGRLSPFVEKGGTGGVARPQSERRASAFFLNEDFGMKALLLIRQRLLAIVAFRHFVEHQDLLELAQRRLRDAGELVGPADQFLGCARCQGSQMLQGLFVNERGHHGDAPALGWLPAPGSNAIDV